MNFQNFSSNETFLFNKPWFLIHFKELYNIIFPGRTYSSPIFTSNSAVSNFTLKYWRMIKWSDEYKMLGLSNILAECIVVLNCLKNDLTSCRSLNGEHKTELFVRLYWSAYFSCHWMNWNSEMIFHQQLHNFMRCLSEYIILPRLHLLQFHLAGLDVLQSPKKEIHR